MIKNPFEYIVLTYIDANLTYFELSAYILIILLINKQQYFRTYLVIFQGLAANIICPNENYYVRHTIVDIKGTSQNMQEKEL